MRPRTERTAILVLALCCLPSMPAQGDEGPTLSVSHAAKASPKHLLPESREAGRTTSTMSSTSGWWRAPVGLVAMLAAFGGIVMVGRRFTPGRPLGTSGQSLRVIGRTALTPKHMMHLVRAGDHVLLIGTGPQGAPALLGELDEVPERPATAGGTA